MKAEVTEFMSDRKTASAVIFICGFVDVLSDEHTKGFELGERNAAMTGLSVVRFLSSVIRPLSSVLR